MLLLVSTLLVGLLVILVPLTISVHRRQWTRDKELNAILSIGKDASIMKEQISTLVKLMGERHSKEEEEDEDEDVTERSDVSGGRHAGSRMEQLSPLTVVTPEAVEATNRLIEVVQEYIRSVPRAEGASTGSAYRTGAEGTPRTPRTPVRASPVSVCSRREGSGGSSLSSYSNLASGNNRVANASSTARGLLQEMRQCVVGKNANVMALAILRPGTLSSPSPLLSQCVLYGYVEVVEVLLESPLPLDWTIATDNGDTVLHWLACDDKHKSPEVVRRLLSLLLQHVERSERLAKQHDSGAMTKPRLRHRKGVSDKIDFGLQNHSGHEAISCAAMYGHLATWWGVMKERRVPYYMEILQSAGFSTTNDHQFPVPTSPAKTISITYAVRAEDWSRIPEQQCFTLVRGIRE